MKDAYNLKTEHRGTHLGNTVFHKSVTEAMTAQPSSLNLKRKDSVVQIPLDVVSICP